METLKSFCGAILLIGLLLGVIPDLSADEATTEIIDRTNWEKAEGLVPEPLLEWIRDGEFMLPVGQLDFDPLEYWPSFVVASRQANAGKYGLNEDDVIVEAGTGQLARHITGTPFPEVDPADPKAATKIIYNKHYASFNTGNKRFTTVSTWIDRSNFEREIEILFLEVCLQRKSKALDLLARPGRRSCGNSARRVDRTQSRCRLGGRCRSLPGVCQSGR